MLSTSISRAVHRSKPRAKLAVRRHAVSECLQIGLVRLGCFTALGESLLIVGVLVEPVATSHQTVAHRPRWSFRLQGSELTHHAKVVPDRPALGDASIDEAIDEHDLSGIGALG
jgi:hypothetical protein